ncbi:unnamed protein product [Parascedosporium putredinis]|uniref:Uncharacterized protein n=1 Tax=Parascedosporium putredinis TaxID=1442378 RepID=A0A9P1HC20_9PEZI|nr:unnamed protein product [Parascedosporium putredinis]CAI8002846.1 unnamed protein product [Parascedosporium putredinis]
MFAARTAISAGRRAAFVAPTIVRRGFTTTMLRRTIRPPRTPIPSDEPNLRWKGWRDAAEKKVQNIKTFNEIKETSDLIGPGTAPGVVPTDIDQSTGLERFELLGKIEGVDVFDMTPLDSSRTGTMENPIVVKSAGVEQYAGCTGSPPTLTSLSGSAYMSKERPIERCPECGSVYKMEFVGAEDHGHHDHHHGPEEPKTMADYVKPEYYYT